MYRRTIHIELYSVDQSEPPVAVPYCPALQLLRNVKPPVHLLHRDVGLTGAAGLLSQFETKHLKGIIYFQPVETHTRAFNTRGQPRVSVSTLTSVPYRDGACKQERHRALVAGGEGGVARKPENQLSS